MLSSGLKTRRPPIPFSHDMSESISPERTSSDVRIEKLVQGGDGLARVGSQVVFVKGGLPEERIRVKVGAKRRGVHYGEIQQILQPSADRMVPPCSIYEQCGGCQLQHVRYQAQLRHKQAILTDAIQRIAKIQIPEIASVIPSPFPLGYRSTIRFVVFKEARTFKLGFYQAETRNPVEVESCLLIPEALRQIVSFVAQKLALLSSLPMFLEHVEFRLSTTSTDVVIVFHGSYKNADRVKVFLEMFHACPNVVGCLIERAGPTRARTVGTPLVVGQDYVIEQFDALTVRIGFRSFVQTNWPIYVEIGKMVREWVGDPKSERVLELYAGTGVLGIMLARSGAYVTLVEPNAFALANARESAALSRVARCRFKQKTGEAFLPSVKKDEYDVILLDPPRTGLSPQVAKELGRILVPRVLYVSCDVATLARDLSRLARSGYRVKRIQPFDMFPQTTHIETLVELQLVA